MGCWPAWASADVHLYWANFAHSIGRANADGSGVNQKFITAAVAPGWLAVGGEYIYWTDAGGGIGRAKLNGSGAEPFIKTIRIGSLTVADGLAVDAKHIYWANFTSNTIGRANLDGSGVNERFITGAAAPRGVAVDGTHIYWTNWAIDTIGRANLDGSGVNQSFIDGPFRPSGVAVDAQYIYWTNLASIGRANLDGSGANNLFISGSGQELAVDGQYLYWADNNSAFNAIGRANVDGSGVNQTFISANNPDGVAVGGICKGCGLSTVTIPPPPKGSLPPVTTPSSATTVTVTAGVPMTFTFRLSTAAQPDVVSDLPAKAELTVPAGDVTFKVTDSLGAILSHSFQVCMTPLPGPLKTLAAIQALPDSCSGSAAPASPKVLAPGASVTVTIHFTSPGTYEYLSTVGGAATGDALAGMKGVLNVT